LEEVEANLDECRARMKNGDVEKEGEAALILILKETLEARIGKEHGEIA